MMSDYTIVKSEWWVPCEHELCHQLHRRFGERCETWRNPMTGQLQDWHHEVHRFTWYIVDGNGRHYQYDPKRTELSWQYDTKREAQQALDRMLQRIEAEVAS